jgi:chromosome segregation ATPase
MKKLGILIAVVLFGIFVFAQEVDMETLLNRIELLEEYTNMIYDVLGTKVSSDDFETVLAELDGRISELETKVLNIQSTIDTGLPALRDMLYELSANLAAVEERLTSYIEVSLLTIKDEAKAELMDEILPMLDDIKVTLDIHDSDILKIYDTLGTLSEQIAAIQEKLASFEEISALIESLTLKLDMHDQDIVNIYDNLSMKADREQVDTLEASVADLQEQIAGLNEILTGLAAQIGDTDYLLRKAIENAQKDLQAKIDTKADSSALENAVKDLQAKIDTKADAKAVEEKVNNVNMIAWIGVVLGAVALVLPFVRGQ